MPGRNYYEKIIILFVVTFLSIFSIWYALVRRESSDWLVGQVAHQVSPYAITETRDGIIVTNLVKGYAFTLPLGFKTSGAKNLSFYLIGAGGVKKCEIRHKEKDLAFVLVNSYEALACEKYLKKIKNSLIGG